MKMLFAEKDLDVLYTSQNKDWITILILLCLLKT